LTIPTDDRSDRFHDIIDQAAWDLCDAGMEDGPAPWRALAWNAFAELSRIQCADCARADLLRLRTMLDKTINELTDDPGPMQ
jgi:hypothetical protein